MKLNLANNLENSQEISKIPESDERDNISTNLSELNSECISSSNDVHSFTPSGIVDGSKQSSDILSHAIFSQNPATKTTSNPYADVQSVSGPFKKSNGIENIHEQKHGLIEFDANLNNFSITNLDRTNGDLNRIEKLSSVSASEEINIPYVKKESKTSESEFMCEQMTPKNVGTTTLDDQIKELMAKSASLENVSEKRENTSCVKNPQNNRHQNVKSNDINSEIQRNLDGICPAVEVPSQKPNSEEPSTATIDFLDPSANEFISNRGNEMFQDSNFVFGDEVFKDPSTFDFLTQFGNTTSLRDLRKESLYIKFDPLVGSPRSVTASDKPLPIMNIVREEERSEKRNINNNADANLEKDEMLNRDSAVSVESSLSSKSPL
ncbi:hypothetical protein R5R35_005154 [Gryllus longicercus]|uniref:Uncharacterized protein n=1 Tax=Gryllus longicercus TaxID=2509291 RepID=A0AAN9Z0Z0_9ORTH